MGTSLLQLIVHGKIMTDQKKSYSRRKFISNFANATALFTVVGSVPFLKETEAYAKTSVDLFLPNQFPSQIEIQKSSFENWSGEISFPSIWVCFPKNDKEVIAVANWAKNNGYKLRPRGKMHNWSPLTIGKKQDVRKVMFIDLTKHMNGFSANTQTTPKMVRAQTGITMESLLTEMEKNGLGLTANPAPGNLTLGGVLAINGHGTAIPAQGEIPSPGHAYGSVSNLILSLTAVVWDSNASQYVLKTFQRQDPDCAAFLTHIGRSLITEVILQAGDNQMLRCQSFIDIDAEVLLGPPGSSPQTIDSFLDQTGRMEVILFPFTDKPWLKVWSVVDSQPDPNSRLVETPYNYPFTDSLAQETSDLVSSIMTWNPGLTPAFGKAQYKITKTSLIADGLLDLYGWSKNLLLYIRPTTLHVTANGYAIVTNRNNIQRVIYEFYEQYKILIDQYESRWQYPMNGPIEIRVTGIDSTQDILLPGAVSSKLSALRPESNHPEWDVAIWVDVLTIPGTPHANEFYQEMEQWIYQNYSGTYASARVEWSKGWGYTKDDAWKNAATVAQIQSDANWAEADRILNLYDPYRIFSSELLDKILG